MDVQMIKFHARFVSTMESIHGLFFIFCIICNKKMEILLDLTSEAYKKNHQKKFYFSESSNALFTYELL